MVGLCVDWLVGNALFSNSENEELSRKKVESTHLLVDQTCFFYPLFFSFLSSFLLDIFSATGIRQYYQRRLNQKLEFIFLMIMFLGERGVTKEVRRGERSDERGDRRLERGERRVKSEERGERREEKGERREI